MDLRLLAGEADVSSLQSLPKWHDIERALMNKYIYLLLVFVPIEFYSGLCVGVLQLCLSSICWLLYRLRRC
jgi:hypothetical protein